MHTEVHASPPQQCLLLAPASAERTWCGRQQAGGSRNSGRRKQPKSADRLHIATGVCRTQPEVPRLAVCGHQMPSGSFMWQAAALECLIRLQHQKDLLRKTGQP